MPRTLNTKARTSRALRRGVSNIGESGVAYVDARSCLPSIRSTRSGGASAGTETQPWTSLREKVSTTPSRDFGGAVLAAGAASPRRARPLTRATTALTSARVSTDPPSLTPSRAPSLPSGR